MYNECAFDALASVHTEMSSGMGKSSGGGDMGKSNGGGGMGMNGIGGKSIGSDRLTAEHAYFFLFPPQEFKALPEIIEMDHKALLTRLGVRISISGLDSPHVRLMLASRF